MQIATPSYQITWEKLPDDFRLPNAPGDDINQPALAAALTDSLEQAGLLREDVLVSTNYGVCATLDGKIVVKAPDWMYVPHILVSQDEVRRSYTPQLQGEIPAIVMEFLSETEGSEYSIKPTYPPGKWFFYEQVLQVPQYAIFDLQTGMLEVYQLNNSGRYDLQPPNAENYYKIEALNLFLGVWQGTKVNRTGYWLRWWNESGEMLPWGVELVEQERQRAEQERQRAEQERQRAEALIAQLRAAGIEPQV
ncbi:MAG: Uma2 family endonuclease [Potamolinea sp.]